MCAAGLCIGPLGCLAADEVEDLGFLSLGLGLGAPVLCGGAMAVSVQVDGGVQGMDRMRVGREVLCKAEGRGP